MHSQRVRERAGGIVCRVSGQSPNGSGELVEIVIPSALGRFIFPVSAGVATSANNDKPFVSIGNLGWIERGIVGIVRADAENRVRGINFLNFVNFERAFPGESHRYRRTGNSRDVTGRAGGV